MAAPSGKGDVRGAAERIERGIELYGAGDLDGALNELEQALKLHPGHARARSYVAWIRGLQAGKNSVGPQGKAKDTLDEDAVRAVSEALEPPSNPEIRALEEQRIGQPAAIPPVARDIADDPEQEPTIERRDVRQLRDLMREANAPEKPGDGGDSPWDPVPLTPTANEQRRPDPLHARQAESTRPKAPSSSTLLGMPPLEPRLLTPDKRKRVAEDRPESVTREFRQQTPTGPNLRPLDVPELTDEQIAGLLALDSPLIPEGRTTPEIELDRIDALDPPDPEIEIEPAREQPAIPPRQRKNDTSPMGLDTFSTGEFEAQSLTPTGVKPAPLRPVAPTTPEDDPYADLHLLPLEVPQDFNSSDESEGTNPTNPFIRGPKLAAYTKLPTEPKLDSLPSPPSSLRPATEPGLTRSPGPLASAEMALAAGEAAAALDASEVALAQAGAGAPELMNVNRALFEQIYAAVLGSPDRTLVHGQATPDLDPRQAFLLSRIDGAMSVEDVLDVSGMPRGEAMRLLALLARRGAVKLR